MIDGGREFNAGGSKESCERLAKRLARRYRPAAPRQVLDETVVERPEEGSGPDLTHNNYFERAVAQAKQYGVTGEELIDPDWSNIHTSASDVVPQPRARAIVKEVVYGKNTKSCLVRTSDGRAFIGPEQVWQAVQNFEAEKSDILLKYSDYIDPLLRRFFMMSKWIDKKSFAALKKKEEKDRVLYMRSTVRDGVEVERVYLVGRKRKAVTLMQRIRTLKQFRDAELNRKRAQLLGMLQELGLKAADIVEQSDFSATNIGASENVKP